MYAAEKDLYSFFLVGDSKITYTKLSAIIEYLSEHKYRKDVRSALYNLMNWGVIIQTHENQYQLARSQLIKGRGFCIGINVELNGKLDYDQFPGIKIYNNTEFTDEFVGEVYEVDIMKVLRVVPNLKKLIDSLCTDSPNGQTDLKKLKILEPISGDWKEVSSSIVNQTDLGLFKSYPFNNQFFEYILKYKSEHFRFKMSEIDRIQFIKMYVLRNSTQVNNVWEYDSDKGKLITRSFFPGLIERQLRIHHVITTGTFPHKREYNVDGKIVKQIERIFCI